MRTHGWVEKSTLEGMEFYHNTKSGLVSWEKPDELKTPEELESSKGEWLWIPHPTLVWQAARKIKVKDDGTSKFKTADGDAVYIKIPDTGKKGYFYLKGSLTNERKQKVPVPLWPLKPTSLKFDEEDLVGLDNLNEGLIAHNLRARYEKNELYTWVGAGRTVLVSVNPYKSLPLYTDEMVSRYHERPPNMHLAPHVYDIAHDAYNTLMYENRDQAILISGESGAGKTVATKHCLGFFAKVAGSESGVEDKILKCNPLLEAFGNAKTIRNINSSRFGKWIEIHFNKRSGHIIGAKITNYLLERSRVVFQQENERNFHIFYQMCNDDEAKSDYNLTDPSEYRYLNQSGVTDVEEIDDAEDFAAVKDAMNQLGFGEEEQSWIMRITAGVLHLGNCEFKKKKEKGNVTGSSVSTPEALENAAKFFDVTKKELERVLCYRSISAKGDKAVIPLKPKDARYACDSLAKGVYGKLFTWLVQRVNESVEGEEGRFIGVLDIFGFEIFENNSFEQLCINFANEKLQQDFNRNTFKEEEALYLAEGIDFQHIEFIDNQVVLDLVERRPNGILPLLDDECIVPEGNDTNYMNKIERLYKKHPKFQTDKHRKLESSLAFEIEHYAGIVKYNAAEFMVKNVDTLFYDMYNAMGASSNKFTQELFPEIEQRVPLKSVSHKFRKQLNDLMEVITQADSRYIRCVKPNDELSSNMFNTARVIEQLRYSGVFEAVEIRKKGYPFRLTHKQFAYRFSCVNEDSQYTTDADEDPEARCREILSKSKHDFSDVKIGNSRVLYRAPEYKMLTLYHHLALETIVPRLQGIVRAGIAREFKRRIVVAEKGLQEALDAGNDLKMVTEAIEAVSGIIGTLKTFWSYPPRNLMKAIKLKEDLEAFAALEQEMEELVADEDFNSHYHDFLSVQERVAELRHVKRTPRQHELVEQIKVLIDKCVLAKIDRDAEAAYNAKNQEAMLAVIAEAAKHNHTTETLDNIRKELAAREKIDLECEIAVEDVDRLRMEISIKQGTEHSYSSKTLKEAKRLVALFSSDEDAFVKLEKEAANRQRDEKREIHRQIRIKELFYESAEGDKFKNYTDSGHQRDPVMYLKGANPVFRKIVGETKIKEGMLNFQAPSRLMSTIPAPLTLLPEEKQDPASLTPEAKAKIKQFKKDAKALFKSILIYMGEKKHPEPDSQAQFVVNQVLNKPELNTEVYYQIIKQLTNNTSVAGTASIDKGWELMGLCLGTFAPAEDFEDYLVMWIRQNAPGANFRPYTSILHNTQFSDTPATTDVTEIRSQFQNINGSRFSLPPNTKYTGPTSKPAPEL